MRNEYIELVKKWLADNDSVSSEALQENAEAADTYGAYATRADDYILSNAAAYPDYSTTANAVHAVHAAANAAADAADAAARAADAADAADYWVKRYEELTNDK